MKFYLVLAFLNAACCSPSVPSADRVISTFSPELPHNYLLVREGSPAAFWDAKCFVIHAEDRNSRMDVERYIRSVIRERLPMLHECAASEWPQLQMSYYAGYGVCVDCGGKPNDPRSAFAAIAFARGPNSNEASAEWQYWRGGTAKLAADQFVFDLANLYVNALTKPIHGLAPNAADAMPAVSPSTLSATRLATRVLEFHVAEYETSPGLTPTHVQGSMQVVHLHPESQLDDSDILRAELIKAPNGEPAIQVTLKPAGVAKMNAVLKRFDRKLLAIVFNGRVISAPVVMGGPDTDLVDDLLDISGSFSREEAESIVRSLNVAARTGS